jgi:hypothetical protein
MTIKLKLSEKDTTFGFTVSATDLKRAVDHALAVTAASPVSEEEKQHVLASSGKKLYVIGMSPETFCCVEVKNAGVEGQGRFAFDSALLCGVIRGRGVLEFAYTSKKKMELKGTKSKFKGTFDTITLDSDQIPLLLHRLKVSGDADGKLDAAVLAHIRNGIKITSLKDIYNESILNCFISLTKKRIEISSFDNHHLALYSADVKSKNTFQLSLPATTFNLIDRFLDEREAEFYVTSKTFAVAGSDFLVHLPPIQAEESHFHVVAKYASGLGKPSASFDFNKDCMVAVTSTLALASKEPRFELAFEKKKEKGRITISLSGDQGSLSDSIDVKNMEINSTSLSSVRVDPRLFIELLDKVDIAAGVSLNMHVSKDKTAASSYVVREAGDAHELVLIGTYYS